MDLAQLGRRSKGTCWRWQEVEAWLDDDSPGATRCLCVLAGAGTGKSTISAAIWDKVRDH